MKINGIVEKKLRLLEQKLAEIREWKISDYRKFKASSMQLNAVERALTVCIEIMIDVSERILSIKDIPPKDSSIENFQELEKLNYIASAAKYTEMVKFRNFIVHRYEYIDPQILFDIITNKLDDYTNFIAEIRSHS